MAVTKYLPLGISDYWFGSTVGTCNVKLLPSAVTSTDLTGIQYAADLASFEVSDSSYVSAGGIAMPDLTRTENATAGVVEYHCGSATWQSTGTFTVAAFRWVVACPYNYAVMAVWDLGADASLTAEPLALAFAESADSAGIYPVLRFRRNLT